MKRKWLIAFILFFILAGGILPLNTADRALAAADTEIAASVANVRSGPGLSYSVTGSLQKGAQVSVISQSEDWFEIEFDGGTGWIASWLTKSIAAEASTETPEGTAVSKVDRLNVRAQADLSAAVLAQMNAGDQAVVIGQSGDWVEVDFHNTRGFVSKQYISISTNEEDTPAPQATDAASFEIAVNVLNVRSKPDLTSDILAKVSGGEVYPVVSTQGNWVEIQATSGETGWVYAFHGHLSDQTAKTIADAGTGAGANTVTILTNGTNLRSEASTSSSVVSRADAGDQFSVVEQQGDWYQVSLPDGQLAFVASWVVTSAEKETEDLDEDNEKDNKPKADRKKGTLNGLTIVLDPGHGGNDGGTVGVRKTKEKDLTLQTAEVLSHHLSSAGAEVVLTRQSDEYVDLRKRVAAGHQAGADAFISIHYDATDDKSVSGFTSYYLNSNQLPLAEYINEGIGQKVDLRDRGVQPGNYLVLRENQLPAVLVELGFLSNYNDERIVTTSKYRDQAALGLYGGIIDYFDSQLE